LFLHQCFSIILGIIKVILEGFEGFFFLHLTTTIFLTLLVSTISRGSPQNVNPEVRFTLSSKLLVALRD
jgi:uncharacterized membrane protein YbaN (DUF454 family)